jgi:hypothetical protein
MNYNERRSPESPNTRLAWSDTLVTLGGLSLMRVAREELLALVSDAPEDIALRARVRGYVQAAHDGLKDDAQHERIRAALGSPEDFGVTPA